MRVFRIVLEQYSDRLFASGRAARWNSKGTFMIYSASSRALACLENVVHRSGEGLEDNFMTMVIEWPATLKVKKIPMENLPEEWSEYSSQYLTRAMGDTWIRNGETPIMQVPSAIIPEESNFLLNPAHPDFNKIQLIQTDPFLFDPRL